MRFWFKASLMVFVGVIDTILILQTGSESPRFQVVYHISNIFDIDRYLASCPGSITNRMCDACSGVEETKHGCQQQQQCLPSQIEKWWTSKTMLMLSHDFIHSFDEFEFDGLLPCLFCSEVTRVSGIGPWNRHSEIVQSKHEHIYTYIYCIYTGLYVFAIKMLNVKSVMSRSENPLMCTVMHYFHVKLLKHGSHWIHRNLKLFKCKWLDHLCFLFLHTSSHDIQYIFCSAFAFAAFDISHWFLRLDGFLSLKDRLMVSSMRRINSICM